MHQQSNRPPHWGQANQAIALNPSDSDILVKSTGVPLNIGRVDEAIDRIERAKGIDPFHPDWFHWQMGWALWEKDDCEAALEAMRKLRGSGNGNLVNILLQEREREKDL